MIGDCFPATIFLLALAVWRILFVHFAQFVGVKTSIDFGRFRTALVTLGGNVSGDDALWPEIQEAMVEDLAYRILNAGHGPSNKTWLTCAVRTKKIPLRGQQMDMGHGVTHKKLAARLYLERETFSEIKKRICHFQANDGIVLAERPVVGLDQGNIIGRIPTESYDFMSVLRYDCSRI